MTYKTTVKDNGGLTIDRYTVEIKEFGGLRSPISEFFGMSEDCLLPNGYNQYIGETCELSKNDRIMAYGEWPKSLRIAIARRIKQLRN